MFKRLPVPFLYVLATGVVLGVVIGFKSMIPYFYWGDFAEYNWYKSALPHVINYLFWPVLVPFIYWTFSQYKFSGVATVQDRFMLVGMSLIIPFVHELATTVIYFVLLEAMDVYHFSEEVFVQIKAAFPSVYIGRIVEFWIIYGLFAAFDYYKKYKNKQAEIIRIEAQLNRTKLAVLKMQLQPHFLFNALNSISSLMDIDVKKAQTVTARLGDLLRGVLAQDERIFIRLEEELNYVKTYLEIEKIRFDDKLEITYMVDERLLSVQIPMFIIQPLVENAIKHGVAKVARGSMIEIEVQQIDENYFQVAVRDNAKGLDMKDVDVFKTGIGLRNIRDRLQELYKDNFSIQIQSKSEQGFEVQLKLPKTNYYEKHSNADR